MTVTASAANRRRVTLAYRWVVVALATALAVGVLLGFVSSRARADTDRSLAAQRHERIEQLRRERDGLRAAVPPSARQPPPATLSSTTTTTIVTTTTIRPGNSDGSRARQQLAALPSREQGDVPGYDRDLFGGWIDADSDCEDTRAEVLVTESLTPIVGDCTIAAGTWDDPYTGTRFTVARQLDVDHMVPLSNAWTSGAWAWQPVQRVAYANDLTDPAHLIAVSASANRSKGDRSPDQWRPPNTQYWCKYAQNWIGIKARWALTITDPERGALDLMLDRC